MILRGARVLDPLSGTDITADVLLSSGIIEVIEPGLPTGIDAEEIDCSGCWLFPGLVDMHVHLRVPGGEDAETLETGLRAAAAGGITRVGMMPNTVPPLDSPELVRQVVREANALGLATVVPVPCVTRGMKGLELTDLRALHDAGASAFTDDGSPVWDSVLLADALRTVEPMDCVIVEHPEDTRLSGGVVNRGRISAMLGLEGIPEEAEVSDVARCLSVQKSAGGMLHLTHLSTSAGVRMVALAAMGGRGVSCDVTPHHLALDEDSVPDHGTLAKMNPPLRSPASRLRLLQELLAAAPDLDWCVASDHAPHSIAAKERPIGEAPFGITGLETMLPLALEVLHWSGGMGLLDLLRRMTVYPARIIGTPEPSILPGCTAEMVLFDPEIRYTLTEVGSFSLSSNTPFQNRPLVGRTRSVWKDGRLIYDDGIFRS